MTTLELGAQVASGRLATVHRGSVAGRAVAVKRARAVPGAAEALRREARILQAAAHPAIVPVLDVLDDPVRPAMVMGWADGGSLGDLLADGPLGADELVHILRPVAGGLEALHLAGVAHLDVTAHNVLLAAAGPVLIDPAPPGAGTPGYADPAVLGGAPASAGSDTYGLAACAHMALTGRLPRRTGGPAIGLALPAPVGAALREGLHIEPRRRPRSPSAFVDRLEAALTGHMRPQPGGLRTHEAPDLPHRRPAAPSGSRSSCPPACTWPFDHWEEEAAAAEERRVALDALLGGGEGPRPARRRRRPT